MNVKMVDTSFPALTDTPAESPLMKEHNVNVMNDKGVKDTKLAVEENGVSNVLKVRENAVNVNVPCSICTCSNVTSTNVMLTCTKCMLSVHTLCYFSPLEAISCAESEWVCESCIHHREASTSTSPCAYCTRPCDDAIVRVIGPSRSRRESNTRPMAHVLCRRWDPMEYSDKNVFFPSLDAYTSTSSCCLCTTTCGIVISCRRVGCGRMMHAMCASTNARGHLEQVSNAIGIQEHVYCDRHYPYREDVGDLLNTLTSKSMGTIIPQDVITQFQHIHRRLDTYTSLDRVLNDVFTVLVTLCEQGLKESKTEQYNIRHLQVLQLTLDTIPQLQLVYRKPNSTKRCGDWIGEELLRLLIKTFNPPQLIRKYSGPIRQQPVCGVCQEPFQERQHTFYCTSMRESRSHVQHWKCTKRKTSSGVSTSITQASTGSGSKKKLKPGVPIVQNGMWSELKLPKKFPSVSDEVVCGVCRAPVDVRAILASRKETKGVNILYEKPPSKFVAGGCYVNLMDTRTAMSFGLQANPHTMGARGEFNGYSAGVVASSTRPTKQLKRSASTDSININGTGDAGVVLAPPRMERINVRRTTRWLACIGHVIRLVLAAEHEKSSQVDDPMSTTEPEPMEATSISQCASSTLSNGNNNTSGSEALTQVESAPTVIKIERIDHSTESNSTPTQEEEGKDQSSDSKPTQAEESVKAEVPMNGNNQIPPPTTLSAPIREYLDEAKRIVRPFDPYALEKMESAQQMLEQRRGPGISILRSLVREYTRFMYIKHTRAVEKARNEKRKREQMEKEEAQERERNRMDREAEIAMKKQMVAMRTKQRQLIQEKTGSSPISSNC